MFLSQAVGGEHDVGLIMDTWTRQMGFPVVTVKHIRGNKYKLLQERFLLNPHDKKHLEKSKAKSRFKYVLLRFDFPRFLFTFLVPKFRQVHCK